MADEQTVEGIGRSATGDDNHLVRGLACFVLGQLRDGRARPTLEAARKDPVAFVRVQAEQALKQMPSRGAGRRLVPNAPPPAPAVVAARGDAAAATEPARGTQRRSRLPALVLSVEPTPGVDVPDAVMAGLRATMRRRFAGASEGRFSISRGKGKRGYRIRGSIAKREIRRQPDGTQVTLVIRLTIATWPQNNLRHVLSAKASAKTKAKHAKAVQRLEDKVLEAAVRSAVADAMDELDRS